MKKLKIILITVFTLFTCVNFTPVVFAEDFAENTVSDESETVSMPSQTFRDVLNGIQVTAKAKEGVFPEGTKMVLSLQNKDVAISKAAELVSDSEKVTDALSIDIAFFDKDGNELEPTKAKDVHITLKASSKVKGSNYHLLHIDENGIAKLVKDASITNDEADFDSVGFSVYAIIGTDGYQEGDIARRTYIFYYEKSDGTFAEWRRQIVKEGETLYEPGIPYSPDESSYFVGWYTGNGSNHPNGESELATFGKITGIKENEDEIVEYHAHYRKKYDVIFWNKDVTDVIDVKEYKETDTEVSLRRLRYSRNLWYK